jgi:acetolactate synthase-1/2/3 large subunit
MRKRVSDVIVDFLVGKGVTDAFMVSGGGSMFLTDALASCHAIRKVCCHHEQAAAMAAVGYAKYKGYAACFVTTGCGGTNTITGILNAWQDSTPLMFVSGQVKTAEMLANKDVPLRQMGIQEANITEIVKSITKYAKTVQSADLVLYELEKAYDKSVSGRPGPVLLDVPIDIQQAFVETDDLRHWRVTSDSREMLTDEEIGAITEKLSRAKRPLVLGGHGIRLAGCTEEFASFLEASNLPAVFARLGIDCLPTEHPLNCGRIGTFGTRAGNFAVQNADFILVLGSRLSVCTTGYAYNLFAREAEIYVVDIDPNEHKKQTVRVDRLFIGNVKDLLGKLPKIENPNLDSWGALCQRWKGMFPVVTEDRLDDSNGISMYAFMDELSKQVSEDAAVVTDAGSAYYVVAQGIRFSHKAQRFVTSGAQAEMGFAVPGGIGVCIARGNMDTIVVTGDGSFQMNIQELQTIVHNSLKTKLFVWNNDGYLSIRETQERVFQKRFLGVDSASGVSFPELEKIAGAYGLKYVRTRNLAELKAELPRILRYDGPVLCEVMCIRDERLLKTVGSKKLEDGQVISLPLEDMSPFLPRDLFYAEMIAKPIHTE